MALKTVKEPRGTSAFPQENGYSASLSTINPLKIEKKNAFLKNKAGELLKTKGNGQEQTENKPETKLSKLLKTIEG